MFYTLEIRPLSFQWIWNYHFLVATCIAASPNSQTAHHLHQLKQRANNHRQPLWVLSVLWCIGASYSLIALTGCISRTENIPSLCYDLIIIYKIASSSIPMTVAVGFSDFLNFFGGTKLPVKIVIDFKEHTGNFNGFQLVKRNVYPFPSNQLCF